MDNCTLQCRQFPVYETRLFAWSKTTKQRPAFLPSSLDSKAAQNNGVSLICFGRHFEGLLSHCAIILWKVISFIKSWNTYLQSSLIQKVTYRNRQVNSFPHIDYTYSIISCWSNITNIPLICFYIEHLYAAQKYLKHASNIYFLVQGTLKVSSIFIVSHFLPLISKLHYTITLSSYPLSKFNCFKSFFPFLSSFHFVSGVLKVASPTSTFKTVNNTKSNWHHHFFSQP